MSAEINIVEPFVKLIKREDFETPLQFIEKIGRVCYKSEDRITEDSAEKFVTMLKENGHLSVLEHERINLYFKGIDYEYYGTETLAEKYKFSYLKPIKSATGITLGAVFSAPLRTFLEMQGNDDLTSAFRKFLGSKFPTLFSYNKTFDKNDYPEIYLLSREEILKDHTLVQLAGELINHTLHFRTNRAVTHDLVRHRPVSYSMESTRYCKYSKEKFGGGPSFIRPYFWNEDDPRYQRWYKSCQNCAEDYLAEIEMGAKPEDAMLLLNHSLKAEIVVTATENMWQHIVDVRWKEKTGKPRPQMLQIMEMAAPILEKESEGRINVEK